LTLLAGSLKSPQRSNRPFTASRSRRAVTLPCGPRRRSIPGLEGLLLHPVRNPSNRMRTRRRLLSSRLFSSPLSWTASRGEEHALARACISGALPAWPTCRTGGNQMSVWPL